MPIYTVEGPDKRTYDIEGPEGATLEQLVAVIQQQGPAFIAQQPKPSTFMGELRRGAEQLISSTRTGLGGMFGSPEEAAAAGIERGREISERAGEGPSFERLQRVYQEQGVLPAARRAVSDLPQALAGQGANIAAVIAGGKLGAMAGSAIAPGVGTIAGGVLGSAAAVAPQLFGTNIERQVAEQRERGETPKVDVANAALATAAQTGLEIGGTAAVFGKSVIKGVLGIADDAALAASKNKDALLKMAQSTIKGGVARGAAINMPVELSQSIIERAQAGLDITSPDAMKEYGEALYLAGLVGGPLGGVGRVMDRSSARRALAAEQPPTPEAAPALPPSVPPEPGAQGELFPTGAAPVTEPAVPTREEDTERLRSLREEFDRLQRENERLRAAPEADQATARAEAEKLAPQLESLQAEIKEVSKRLPPEDIKRPGPVPVTPVEGQYELAFDDRIRTQDLPNYGIPAIGGTPAQIGVRGWMQDNVVGKTVPQIERLVKQQPELIRGEGLRARALREMITPQPAAFKEPVREPRPETPSGVAEQPELDFGGAEPSVAGPVEPQRRPRRVRATEQPAASERLGLEPAGDVAEPGDVVAQEQPAALTPFGTQLQGMLDESWEDFKPDKAPPLKDLPDYVQTQWAQRVADASKGGRGLSILDTEKVLDKALENVGYELYNAQQEPSADATPGQQFRTDVDGQRAQRIYEQLTPEAKATAQRYAESYSKMERRGEDTIDAIREREKALADQAQKEADEDALEAEQTKPRKERRAKKQQDFLSIYRPDGVTNRRMPATKRRLKTLRNEYRRGKLSEGEYILLVNGTLDSDDDARLAKDYPERQRGADFIRERLLNAKRKGLIDEDGAELAGWFIQNNPQLVADLGISISSKAPEGTAGQYLPLPRIIRLIKERGDDLTAVHEILHHLERMMPLPVQQEIRRAWSEQFLAAKKAATSKDDKQFFELLDQYHFGDPETRGDALYAAALKMLEDGTVDIDNYQFINPSEFWAVNASQIVANRYGMSESILSRLSNWLKELGQKIKSAFGFRSNAALIKALDSLAKSDGKFVSDKMLMDQDVEFRAVSPTQQAMQAGFSPQPGGTARQIQDITIDRITKFRRMMTDAGATVFNEIAKNFNNSVTTALKDPRVEAVYRQAEASDQLVPAVYRLGVVRRDKGTNLWKAAKASGVKSVQDITEELTQWGETQGLKFEAAWNRADELLRAAREHEFRRLNKTQEKGRNFPVSMSDADIDRLYAEYQQDKKLQAIKDDMDKLRFDFIDQLVAVGRITKEMGADWKAATAYVPFDRVAEMDSKFRQKRSVGRGIAQLGQLPELVNKAGTNRPPKNVLENYIGLIGWMTQEVVRQDATLRTLRALEDIGQAQFRTTPPPESDRKVATYVNGEERYFVVASPYHVAAFRSDITPLPGMFTLMGQFSRALRTAITAIPTFTATQLPQDIQRAIMASGVRDPVALTAKTLGNFKDFAKAATLGKLSDVAPELSEFGVVGGVDFHKSNPAESFLQDIGKRNRTLLKSSKFGELLNRLNGVALASDIAVRKAIYDQTIEETQGDRQLALERAREIINFRRFGAGDPLGLLHIATQTIPFFNAYLQGTDVLYRSLTGKEAPSGLKRNAALKLYWTNVGYLMAASTLYAMLMAGDEEYENMDLRERDRTWVIGGGIGIPVPAEIGILFKSIPERVLEVYRKHGTPEEAVATEALLSWFRAAYEEYLGRQVPIPAAAKPLLENFTNYSFLTGRPLEGIFQQGQLPSERVTTRTSELAKQVAQFTAATTGVEVSPIDIDNVVRGYLGTTGALVLAAADQAINPNRADRPLHQIVGLSAFAYDPVGTRRTSEFYDLREKVVQTHNSLNQMMKTNPERAFDFAEKNAPLLMTYKMVNSTLEELEKTRAMKRYLDTDMAAQSMTGEERLKMKQEIQQYEQNLVEWVREAKNSLGI